MHIVEYRISLPFSVEEVRNCTLILFKKMVVYSKMVYNKSISELNYI